MTFQMTITADFSSGTVRLLVVAGMTAILTACSSAQVGSDQDRLLSLADDIDQQGDHSTAAAMYERAIDRNGSSANVLVRLGQARLDAGDNEGAARAFRDALREDIQLAPALLGLGTAQLRLGEAQGARRSLVEAVKTLNSTAAWSRLGAAQALSGEPDEAVNSFRRAMMLDPKSLDVKTNLALAQALAGNGIQAGTEIRDVVNSPLAESRHYRNAVLILVLAGRSDVANHMALPDVSTVERQRLIAQAQRVAALPTAEARARALGLQST
ncbi:Flp pilus assembly protein TadD [Kushneria marisflavi]|nr:Flp pilus assembly protein TadD [Kushneria marisflavi]